MRHMFPQMCPIHAITGIYSLEREDSYFVISIYTKNTKPSSSNSNFVAIKKQTKMSDDRITFVSSVLTKYTY